jgi:hypothetical protein
VRDTLTTIGEVLGAVLIIAGVSVQFGFAVGLMMAGVVVVLISWLLSE